MIAVLSWTLAGVALAVLCVLFLPIGLRVSARTAPVPHLRVDLRLLAGLTPWFAVVDTSRPARPRRRADRERPQKDRARRRRPGRRVRQALPDLLVGLLRVFRLRRLRVEGRFGLGDPAETGTAYGYLSALVPALRGATGGRVSVAVAPDFEGARLDGSAEAELRVLLARILRPALRFAWAAYGPAR